MKIMKKITLFCFAFFAFFMNAHSQDITQTPSSTLPIDEATETGKTGDAAVTDATAIDAPSNKAKPPRTKRPYWPGRGASYARRQLLAAGHWALDAMATLYGECAMATIFDNAPMSVGELRVYFSRIQYEKLSRAGRALYKKVQDFLFSSRDAYIEGKFDFAKCFFAVNLSLNPRLSFRTNDNIDWSFATDYTGGKSYPCYEWDEESQSIQKLPHHSLTHKSGGEYRYTGNFNGTGADAALLTLPIMLNFGDIFMIETDIMLAKSFWGTDRFNAQLNIPDNSEYVEFYSPRNAYGTIGWEWEKWGLNATFGRTGLQIGRSLTGSVIYNNSFDTQCFFQFNVFCQYLKYAMDITQIEPGKYLYLHQVEVTPWKFIKLALVEGTLINEPFEIRYLNPLMIMHSFGSWMDYSDDKEEDIYGESHVCAYLAAMLDLVPCRGLRIYALYAQNEIQASYELGSASSRAIPNGIGTQVGFELNIPHEEGFFHLAAEAVYTTPFLYTKQGADWSLFSKRTDFQHESDIPLYSWIGTPFGPDAIAMQAKFGYTVAQKWSADFLYTFVAHGSRSFGEFESFYTDKDGDKFSSYYPSVLRHAGIFSDEESEDLAQDRFLTGCVSYTNNFTLRGEYTLNSHLQFDASFSTIFVLNNKNKKGDTQVGVEGAFGVKYNLF